MWGRRCVFESGKKYEKYISKVIPFHSAYKTVCIKYCCCLQKIEEFGFHICWLGQELCSFCSLNSFTCWSKSTSLDLCLNHTETMIMTNGIWLWRWRHFSLFTPLHQQPGGPHTLHCSLRSADGFK